MENKLLEKNNELSTNIDQNNNLIENIKAKKIFFFL